MIEKNPPNQPTMDSKALYREDVFTDRMVGTLRQLTPVKSDGTTDTSRPVLYAGQAQLLTAMGAIPISFDIEAGSLDEAVRNFADAAKVAVDQTMDELQELRREAASSIIVPEPGAAGLPRGGKIQLR